MFSLGFLNSGFLIASLSALIPILIYFFAKKRPERIVFSSLKFIISSKEERNSKINLKNILLLIIRTLILLLLTLIFARPILKTFLGIDSNYHAPTTISVIADNSLSMDYYADDIQKFELLKNNLKKINNKLTNNDFLRIYTKDNYISSQKFIQGSLPDTLIQKMEITYQSLPLDSLITRASKDLKDPPTANHELYLFTDGNEEINLQDSLISLKYALVDQSPEWNNLSARLKTTQIVTNNNIKQLSIDFIIYNFGPKDVKDKLVRLNYNERSYDRFVSIESNKSWQGNYTIPLENTGWQKGFIEVQDEYYLQDNRAYYSFYYNLDPKITIITDEQDISLPLKTMASIFTSSLENIKFIPPNYVNNQLLTSTDIFVFYKPNSLPSNILSLLAKLEEKEKGFLLVLNQNSDQSVSDYLNSKYEISLTNEKSKEHVPNWTNPYNAILKEVGTKHFSELRFNDLVPAIIQNRSKILLADDNQPIIVADKYSFLLFFDANNDFVTHASYPVFMNKIFESMSNSNIENESYYLGNSIDLPANSLVDDKEIIGTNFIFSELGIYKVNNGIKTSYFAVNLGEEQLKESLARNSNFPQAFINISEDWESHLFSESASFELLKYLIYAIILLFIAELLIVKYWK